MPRPPGQGRPSLRPRSRAMTLRSPDHPRAPAVQCCPQTIRVERRAGGSRSSVMASAYTGGCCPGPGGAEYALSLAWTDLKAFTWSSTALVSVLAHMGRVGDGRKLTPWRRWLQAVIATTVVNASDGVFHPRDCRGRWLRAWAMVSRSPSECSRRLVPLGRYWRSSPLVFSLEPRCQGERASAK
jgi:hypothetical protein